MVEVGQGRGSGFVEGGAKAEHEGGYAKVDEFLESLADLVRIAGEDVLLGLFDGNTGAFGVYAEGRGDSLGVFADEEVHVEGEGDVGGSRPALRQWAWRILSLRR